MNHYLVQTGWKNKGSVPELKGNIQVIAINRKVAELAVLVKYVWISNTLKEISAKGDRNLPKIPTNLLCGSKLLIAN